MPDPVWTPSLDDTGLDELSTCLRAAVRGALPELLDIDGGRGTAGRDGRAGRAGRVETEPAPGLTLRLEVSQARSVVRDDRPVLEVWLRGTLRHVDRGTGRPLEMPVSGECRVDLNTGAIVHLRL